MKSRKKSFMETFTPYNQILIFKEFPPPCKVWEGDCFIFHMWQTWSSPHLLNHLKKPQHCTYRTSYSPILINFINLNCFVLGQLLPVLICIWKREVGWKLSTFLTIVDVWCSFCSSTFYFTLFTIYCTVYTIKTHRHYSICTIAHYAVVPLYRGTVSSVMTVSIERR